MIKNSTKANVLKFLKEKASMFQVEDIYDFSVAQWLDNPDVVLSDLRLEIKSHNVIVRSSAINEDSTSASMAGQFKTVMDVKLMDDVSMKSAVETVINSYSIAGHGHPDNQVLVQSQTGDVSLSGVVFTWELGTNAPYYIINYDDETGKTDTITSGVKNKMVAISRFVQPPYRPRWAVLLSAVKEIEGFFPDLPLDLEFAIKRDGTIVIFQVRSLAPNKIPSTDENNFVKSLIEDMKDKFVRFNKRVPHLCGSRTIYSDMSDWNPSEIIGDRPNTLDYTLYRFLITDNIWHEARRDLGYVDVFPGELMTSFGRKPYIDVKLSFNSMMPASLPFDLREKLIAYYLDKLHNSPELQDKVEFEILWTCYDFTLDDRLEELFKHGFSSDEVKLISGTLKEFTVNIIKNSEATFKVDVDATNKLYTRKRTVIEGIDNQDASLWDVLTGVHYIALNCRKFGTLPFSRIARMAFIAKSLLISLRDKAIVDDEFYHSLLLSVQTVAKKFYQDLNECNKNNISMEGFFHKYGHLRAGTYDITSVRYDQQTSIFNKPSDSMNLDSGQLNEEEFKLSAENEDSINRELQAHGIDITATQLINFIIRSLEYRELLKFEFTKSLSDILELISLAGNMMGLKREELCHVDFMLLMRYRNPEVSDVAYVKKRILQSIERHSSEKDWYRKVILPPVIRSDYDFDYVEFHTAKPNFITDKSIVGEMIVIGKHSMSKNIDIKNKIVLIENADPGFDWIFTKSPKGLITKYGGLASHMAIRCAEFGLPAVIGCGEVIYKNLLDHLEISFDCRNKKIEYLSIRN